MTTDERFLDLGAAVRKEHTMSNDPIGLSQYTPPKEGAVLRIEPSATGGFSVQRRSGGSWIPVDHCANETMAEARMHQLATQMRKVRDAAAVPREFDIDGNEIKE